MEDTSASLENQNAKAVLSQICVIIIKPTIEHKFDTKKENFQ